MHTGGRFMVCKEEPLLFLLNCNANNNDNIQRSSDTGRRDQYLHAFILSSGIEIYNAGNTTSIAIGSRQKVLNITPGNTLMNGLVQKWRVFNIANDQI